MSLFIFQKFSFSLEHLIPSFAPRFFGSALRSSSLKSVFVPTSFEVYKLLFTRQLRIFGDEIHLDEISDVRKIVSSF